MENTEVNASGQTQLARTKLTKVPKSFSIESLIASTRPTQSEHGSHADIVRNSAVLPSANASSTSNFPPNISAAAAAAAYNPWIHNYLMHQKFTEQFLDFASSNINSQAAKSVVAPPIEVESLAFDVATFQVHHLDQNHGLSVDRETHDRLFQQYINSCDPKISGMFAHANELYKNYHSFSDMTTNVHSDRNGFDERSRPAEQINKKPNAERPNGRDGSESDELVENELESDCSSEVSLSLSRDGEHDQQGNSGWMGRGSATQPKLIELIVSDLQIIRTVSVRVMRMSPTQTNEVQRTIPSRDDDEPLSRRSNCWNWRRNFMPRSI